MKQLDGMRKIEGAKILEDTMARINQITTTLGFLKKRFIHIKMKNTMCLDPRLRIY